MSSLSDFTQFEAIMEHVIEAKKLNKDLKVSMDPGFEYTSVWRDRLQKLIRYVDYVFLNKSEKNNLGLNVDTSFELYQNICEYFTSDGVFSNSKLIVKYDDRHEILSFANGKTEVRTVRHQKLFNFQLNNDTGAGDSFAGGFVAGMMVEDLNSDVEGPIQLGVLAAKGRMTSFDYENPYLKIQNLTDAFFANR